MDGPSGMRGPISGDTSLQSNELVENLNPLRTSYATLRAYSGGPGKFRGGLGLVRQVEILSKEAFLSVVTDRSAIPPFGVYGGRSGFGQRWSVLRNGVEKLIPFDGKASRFKLGKGDIALSLTAGGGGYGDPLDRDPESVRRDVIEGYVSMESAAKIYGVVLKKKDLSIDKEATRKQRKALKERRRTFAAGNYGAPLFVKGMKGVLLNREEAKTFRPGAMVEIYHHECAVPYRARIILKTTVRSRQAWVDDEMWQMMGLEDGDSIQIINLFSQP